MVNSPLDEETFTERISNNTLINCLFKNSLCDAWMDIQHLCHQPYVFFLLSFFRFIEKLQQDIPGKGVKRQLEILCSIYALFHLHKHLGDFLSTGCITPKQGSLANDQLRSLYSQVCPK